MPETGVQLQPDDKILTRKEIKTLGEMFVTAGVNKIRLTGGEVSGFILLFSFFFFFFFRPICIVPFGNFFTNHPPFICEQPTVRKDLLGICSDLGIRSLLP